MMEILSYSFLSHNAAMVLAPQMMGGFKPLPFSLNPVNGCKLMTCRLGFQGEPHWHQSFAIEDFDQDGYNDLMLTQSDSVYLQLLKGPDWLDDNNTLIVGLTPISMQAGDWNNDGRKDIAVANRETDSISILLNNDNDNFTTAATLDTAEFPQQLMQGDWNGDNVTDLASISVGENLLQLWKGKGDGTFEKTLDLDTPSSPQQLEVADFDCDGRQDLAISSRSAEVLRIWYGDGSGNFGNQFDLPAGRGPSSFGVADFNEDGVLDFVISNRFVVVFTSGHDTHRRHGTGPQQWQFCSWNWQPTKVRNYLPQPTICRETLPET
jgi:hypothetical protein